MGNVLSAVPYNGQVSQVYLPVSCTNVADASEVLQQKLTFSATAPLAAGSFYLTNVQAALPYPGDIFGGKLNLDLAFSNAVPANSRVSQTSFSSSTLILPGNDITDTDPKPFSDITLGEFNLTGSVSHYSVSGLSYQIINKENKSKTYTCTVPPNIAGTVVNDGSTVGPLPGVKDVPQAAINTKATRANLPLSCRDGVPYNLTISATSPVGPYELFQITDFIFFFTIPASRVAQFKASANADEVEIGILVSKEEVGGSLAGLGFNLTSASPALYDLVTDGYTRSIRDDNTRGVIASYKTTGGDLTLAFPLVGSLALNPFQITGTPIFSAKPLGINALIADKGLHRVEQVACDVLSGVQIWAGPIP